MFSLDVQYEYDTHLLSANIESGALGNYAHFSSSVCLAHAVLCHAFTA